VVVAGPRKQRARYGEYGEDDISRRAVGQIERRLGRTRQHALAREVELALSNYRWTHDLTQHQLADILGVKQPQVARLESGVVTPTLTTLMRITQQLGIEFTLELRPEGMTVSSRQPR
jgi:DNA-binding XRE family transcriptional regulator